MGRLPSGVLLAAREAIDNIEFCAERYTNLPASEFDEMSYEVCAWGAAYVYLRQMGWGDALSAAEEGQATSETGDITALATGLVLVVQVAEATHEAAVATVEVSASGGIATQGPEEVSPFQKCIDRRDANREACEAAYPDDSTSLQTCYEAADIASKECAKKTA